MRAPRTARAPPAIASQTRPPPPTERHYPMATSDLQITPIRWADEAGGTKHPGVRVGRARGWVFVPDTEVLELANLLADHLEEQASYT